MRRFRRKISKHRGSRHVGRGKNKRGRGKGSRMTNKRVFHTNIQHYFRHEPERFHAKGFVRKTTRGRAINLSGINAMAGNEIDVTTLGYSKVLSGGKLGRAVNVVARSFSKPAAEKIEQAGGKAIVKGEI
ncbi:uL15 family ribosomal protein [Candidatus Micrarchaeota archaeon]|nr:uL15 family ribosomal protein [Candidatus Micrarchaeota archaeon]